MVRYICPGRECADYAGNQRLNRNEPSYDKRFSKKGAREALEKMKQRKFVEL
jgi:hypothetical protein